MDSIVLKNVVFHYPEQDGATPFKLGVEEFSANPSEQWVLSGPSGSGKSTLLNILAGELIPQTGSVMVLETPLHEMSLAQRQDFRIQNIGFIFQDFPLVPYLNAVENVILPYFINPSITLNAEVRTRAEYLLSEMGLSHRQTARPAQLSQGEKQRVAIARALITNPRLILADEPTAGLDLERSHGVMEYIQELAKELGITLVVVTHEPQMIDRFTNQFSLGGQG